MSMKQPRAIIPIFFTEAWERFGYYSIQGVLVLFLINSFQFSDQKAFSTLGEFLSWTYIAPVFGGLLANFVLGYRQSILFGALVLAVGYGLLAYSSYLFLHLGLSCIVVGNGLLKPNSPSFLGQFYYPDDPRRYPGFTMYFTGINIGGFVAIILANLASHYFGYQAVFTTACLGMLIAIVAFRLGYREFENRGWPIAIGTHDPLWRRTLSNKFNLVMLLMIVVLAVRFLQHHVHISTFLLILVMMGVIVSLFYIQSTATLSNHNKLIAVIILTATAVIFWAENLQIFFSLLLFTDRFVNRHLFGLDIPPSFFIVLEPALLITLGPLIARLWDWLSTHHREPGPTAKFTAGLMIISAAMALLALSTYMTADDQLISPWWIVSFYVLMTTSIIFVSPTGMAMITELAPPKLTGFMMGVWYMVLGLGSLLASVLASFAIGDRRALQTIQAAQEIYGRAFCLYALIALLIGAILWLLSPKLKKLIDSQV